MIVLEIDDEASASFFEVLGITPEQLAGKNDKEAARAIRDAAALASKPYAKTKNSPKKEIALEADKKLSKINDASVELKDAEKRKAYTETLAMGKGASLEILRPQPVAPPFFRSRSARFRTIEHLMREAGLYT